MCVHARVHVLAHVCMFSHMCAWQWDSVQQTIPHICDFIPPSAFFEKRGWGGGVFTVSTLGGGGGRCVCVCVCVQCSWDTQTVLGIQFHSLVIYSLSWESWQVVEGGYHLFTEGRCFVCANWTVSTLLLNRFCENIQRSLQYCEVCAQVCICVYIDYIYIKLSPFCWWHFVCCIFF